MNWIAPSSEEVARAKMNVKANTDSMYNFIGELNAEQLHALYLIFYNSQSERGIASTMGLLIGQLKLKFDACLCGERAGFHTDFDHMDDPAPQPAPQVPNPIEAGYIEIEEPVDGSEEHGYHPRTWAEQDANLDADVVRHINSVLDRYKLVIVQIDNGNIQYGKGQYMCTRCNMIYVSLTDRMAAAPDGCHGCHLLEAHGGLQPE